MDNNDRRYPEKIAIRDRINSLLKEKNIKRSGFAKSVGIPQKTLDNQLSEKQKVHVSLDTLLAVHERYPEITLEWLIDGEDPKYSYKYLEKMDNSPQISEYDKQPLDEHIISDVIEHVKLLHKPLQYINDYEIIPVYDLNSETGETDKTKEFYSLGKVVEMRAFPFASKSDIIIRINGETMSPEYKPGTFISLREVKEWDHFLEFGHDYLIILEDKRHLFREVQAGSSEETFRLVSPNPKFSECEIKKELIHSVWIAMATLNLKIM